MFVQGWVVTDDMRKRGTDREKETQINTDSLLYHERSLTRSLSANTLIPEKVGSQIPRLIHLSQGMLGKARFLPADIDLSHTELQSLHGATHTDKEGDLFTHI